MVEKTQLRNCLGYVSDRRIYKMYQIYLCSNRPSVDHPPQGSYTHVAIRMYVISTHQFPLLEISLSIDISKSF